MENETDENLSVVASAVITIYAVTVLIGAGALAKLGWDISAEGIRMIKAKKNQKK